MAPSAPFAIDGDAAARDHGARGERRHRQDVRHRRPRRPVRRRGRRRSSGCCSSRFTRLATGELRERVRERLAAVERGLRAAPGRRGAPCEDRVVELLAATRRPPRRAAAAERLGAGAGRLRRGDDRHHARLLPGDARAARGGRRARAGRRARRGPRRPARGGGRRPVRLRRFHREADAADRAAPRRWRSPARPRSRIPGVAARRRGQASRPPTRVRLAGGGARRARPPQAAAAGDDLRRPAAPPRRARSRGRDGDAVAARLRERYRVVLVDEFQDTDPVQWSILERAFAATGTTLVLIADPKQAIYAFRGADVYAYLAAAESTRTEHARRQLAQRPAPARCLRRAAATTRSSATRGSSTARCRRRRPAQRTGGCTAPRTRRALRLRVVLDRTDRRADPRPASPQTGAARDAGGRRPRRRRGRAAGRSGAEVECVAEARRGEREPVYPGAPRGARAHEPPGGRDPRGARGAPGCRR